MKKTFTILIAAIAAILMMAQPVKVMGEDKTITLTHSSFGLTTTYATHTATVSDISFTINQGYKGGSNPNFTIQMNSSKGDGTLYNTTPIPGLKSVTVNVSSMGSGASYAMKTGTSQNPTTNSSTGNTTTQTFNATSGDKYFELKVTKANYFTSIVITYDDSSISTVDPPTFDPADGTTFDEYVDVTITPAANTTMYYTTDGTTPTVSGDGYTTPQIVHVTSTTTITAIATDGDNNSDPVDATYTKLSFNNIEDITEAGTYTVKGTVVATCTKGFVVGDGTGYVYVYLNAAPSVSINDLVTVSGNITLFANGKIFEFTNNPAPTIGSAQSSNYVYEDPTSYTGSQIATYITTNHLSDYVQYEGTFTYSSLTITLDGTSVLGKISYPNNSSSMENLDGKKVRVSGYFTGTNQNNEYFYTMLGSIEEVAVAVQNPAFSPVAGGYSDTKSVTITCATEGATIYYTTNDSDPTNTSTQYNGAITVSSNTTIKAIAYVGDNHSDVVTAEYKLITDDNTTVNTVTQALSFGSYPQNGVFVSGIVCTAPSSLISGSMLTYYISADGTETDRLQVYKGMNMDNTAFTAVDDIQVGDIVTIYGNVKVYNSTTEFDQGNYIVAFQRPVIPVINAEDVNIEYNATSGNIEYTITNGTGNVTAAITTGNWLTLGTITSTEVPFTCLANSETTARTATVTLKFTGAADKVVTVTQAAYSTEYNGQGTFTKVTTLADLEDGGYYVIAYTYNSNYYAMKNSMNSDNQMYGTKDSDDFSMVNEAIVNPVTSIVWKLEKNVVDNNTYWNLYNEAEKKYCYISGTNAKSFHMGTTSEYSYIVTVNDNSEFLFKTTHSGNRCIANYQGTTFRTYAANNNPAPAVFLFKLGEAPTEPYMTVAPDQVTVPSTGGSGSLAIDYDNMTIANAAAITIQYYDDNNQTISAPAWMSNVSVAEGATSGYVINYTIDQNDDADRTATFKVYASDGNENVYSNLVTFTQSVYVAPVTYTLATSIENGRHYIIANGSDKAMGAPSNNTNNRTAVDITITDNVATVSSDDVRELVINGPDAEGRYTIYDAEYPGYLYNASTSGNSYLRTQTNNNTAGQWTITFDNDNKATITSYGNSNRPTIMYNSGSTLFNCYASGQSAIYLYMKDEVSPQYDFYKDIAAHTNATGAGNTDGWNFIALPVTSDYTPAGSMIANEYDLYQLNDSKWENYKEHEGNANPGFDLINGRGYLYANSANTTLHFSGAINEFTPEGNANVKNLSDGWNLIGNPYNIPIYINKPYYRMNAAGTAVETADGITSIAIPAGSGVIVKATGDSESVTFTTSTPDGANNSGNIQMSVIKNNVRGNDVQDKAIVSFNEGSKLEKFQLFEGDTKLYFPMEDADYAIVSSDGHGTMPVNFKAKEMGRYTISVETEGIDMSYLHLIDRLTGEDVNLLLDNEYSFIASNNDSEERFILSFTEKGYDAHGNEIFVYQSGNDLIVNGEGELQIFDVMGRMVKNTTINGVEAIAMPQGVYIFKLNGNVQKIVVR